MVFDFRGTLSVLLSLVPMSMYRGDYLECGQNFGIGWLKGWDNDNLLALPCNRAKVGQSFALGWGQEGWDKVNLGGIARGSFLYSALHCFS